ncbi:MAG: phosphatase PAP2 family protein [Actinomycetota bacterium]|nr:phosphatase PAP2 family protein [Actinomycetota bacterium]
MLRALDVRLFRLLRTRGHAPLAELLVLRFTRLGEHGFLWLAMAVAGAAVDGHQRSVYLRTGRAVAATYLANTAVKVLVRRARPLFEDLPALAPTYSGASYPSAHTSMSFAGARVLSGALPAGLVYAAAVAMALSRPYVGVHYPSDVVAGAILGTVVADVIP